MPPSYYSSPSEVTLFTAEGAFLNKGSDFSGLYFLPYSPPLTVVCRPMIRSAGGLGTEGIARSVLDHWHWYLP